MRSRGICHLAAYIALTGCRASESTEPGADGLLAGTTSQAGAPSGGGAASGGRASGGLNGAASGGKASGGGLGGASFGGASSGGAASGRSGEFGGSNGGDGYFPAGAIWYRDVSSAPKDGESDRVMAWLDTQGFGTGSMRIDFSIEVLRADASTPMRTFTADDGAFYEPDCDKVEVPVPAGGAIEGETGYACTQDGDCHLIVVHQPSKQLFEMWRANITGPMFVGGCLAVWDMARVYGPNGRGAQCTSADAAGYPIAPLLFSADEIKAGEINHAIRFILPNARIRRGVYLRPATHVGGPTGPDSAPPYGARLRLRADFPVESLSVGARVVARALQKYGMLLADGGNIALTAQSDRFTAAKWQEVGLDSFSLRAIKPSDFQMVEAGERIPSTNDCVREP